MTDEIIPIVMFISIAVVFVFWFFFRHRGRMEMQYTIRLALEKGTELTPELIRQIGEPEPPRDKDLRRGLIWLAIAFGLAIIAVAIGSHEQEAFTGIISGAALPFTIGCAYLIMHRFGKNKES
jgi:hypothetical protein